MAGALSHFSFCFLFVGVARQEHRMRNSTALHVSEAGVWIGAEMEMSVEYRVRPDGNRLRAGRANDSRSQRCLEERSALHETCSLSARDPRRTSQAVPNT